MGEPEGIQTIIRYFPENITYGTQQWDSFMEKNEEHVKEAKKFLQACSSTLEFVNSRWSYSESSKSFCPTNCRWLVIDLNYMPDRDGISYATKALILCGIELEVNDRSEEPHIKPSTKKHHSQAPRSIRKPILIVLTWPWTIVTYAIEKFYSFFLRKITLC